MRINYYVVPNPDPLRSGPGVRTAEMRRVLVQHYDCQEISGDRKVAKALKAHADAVAYVESSTNRLSLQDILALLILRFVKRNDIRTYIRDVYPLVFRESYSTPRRRITAVAYRLSSIFYHSISSLLLFPTDEMGTTFFRELGLRLKPMRAFPPGVRSHGRSPQLACFESRNLLYVGGLEYENSGLDELLRVFAGLPADTFLHIVTRDPELVRKGKLFASLHMRIKLHRMNKDEWLEYFRHEGVHCAIHARPRNPYDDMTFPIKLFDYLEAGLPFFSLDHKPLKSTFSHLSDSLCSDLDEMVARIRASLGDREAYEARLTQLESCRQHLTYEENFRRAMGLTRE